MTEFERIETLTERDFTQLLRDRLKANDNIKPRRSEITAEFALYKQELIDAENARIAEVTRIALLKDRISKLKHGNAAASIIAGQPNAALVFKHIIESDDLSLLQAIEVRDGELLLEADDQKAKQVDRIQALDRLQALDLTGVDSVIKDIIIVLRR